MIYRAGMGLAHRNRRSIAFQCCSPRRLCILQYYFVLGHPTYMETILVPHIRFSTPSYHRRVENTFRNLDKEAAATGGSLSAESSRSDNWGEQWTMGAMRGWRFRVLQVRASIRNITSHHTVAVRSRATSGREDSPQPLS